jgi:mannose-6-phosphate isomerase-like protein (cupin superfamily)
MVDQGAFVIRAAGSNRFAHTEGGSFHLVQREELGLGEVSVGVNDNPPGMDGATYRHSCGEVFVVYEGRGIYTVGDTELVADPGDIVVIPANIWHSFRPDGDSRLRHVAVYDSGHIDIELDTGRVISDL